MTRLTKNYLAVLVLLGIGLALVAVDSLRSGGQPGEAAKALAGLPGPSLSVPYFEARWRLLDGDSGLFFPGMRPLRTMDYVYAR